MTFPSDEIVTRLNEVIDRQKKVWFLQLFLDYDVEKLKLELAAEVNKLFLEGKIKIGEKG